MIPHISTLVYIIYSYIPYIIVISHITTYYIPHISPICNYIPIYLYPILYLGYSHNQRNVSSGNLIVAMEHGPFTDGLH